jgi:hypothetical protein
MTLSNRILDRFKISFKLESDYYIEIYNYNKRNLYLISLSFVKRYF